MLMFHEKISHLQHGAGESIAAAKPGEAISLPRFPVYSLLTPPADRTVQTHRHEQAFMSQLLPRCNFHDENLNCHKLQLSGRIQESLENPHSHPHLSVFFFFYESWTLPHGIIWRENKTFPAAQVKRGQLRQSAEGVQPGQQQLTPHRAHAPDAPGGYS